MTTENFENIVERINFLREYGFNKEEVNRICRQLNDPSLYPIDRMNALCCVLEDYGFSKKQIKNIILSAPKLLGYSTKIIVSKLKTIERPRMIGRKKISPGKNAVIELCCAFPKILFFKPGKNETLDKKIRLHLLIWGDIKEMTKMAMNMIQSNRKTLTRISEMKRKKINWCRNKRLFA